LALKFLTLVRNMAAKCCFFCATWFWEKPCHGVMGTYGNLIRDPGTSDPEDFFMIPLGLGFAETPCLGIESSCVMNPWFLTQKTGGWWSGLMIFWDLIFPCWTAEVLFSEGLHWT
jgi:hypothetical protein